MLRRKRGQPGNDDERVDRRRLLRLGGMAAVGAAGAALATAVDASPAAAGVDGDVVLNADNTGSGSARTAIIETYPNHEVFGAFNGPANGNITNKGVGIRGRAGGDTGNFAGRAADVPIGIYGESREGKGIFGDSYSGDGVYGNTDYGYGVFGQAGGQNGVGVGCNGPNGTWALKVFGRAQFTRSGVTKVPAGRSSVTTYGVGLSPISHVLATLQTHAAGVALQAAVPNLSGPNHGKITIYLTASAPAGGVKVAWFVLD